MPPPKAAVWSHYIKVDQAHFKAGRVACRYCGHHTSSWSVQRAQKHLRECRAAILANQVSTEPEAVGTPRGTAFSPGQQDTTTQSGDDYRDSPTPMPNMTHNTALQEQEQILGQSMDVGRADDGGVEQVMRLDENERPQVQQSRETARVQQQQSQQPYLGQPVRSEQSQQPQIIHSLGEKPQVGEAQVEPQLQLQQSLIQQAPQPITSQQQSLRPEQTKQHTLSDAEVQSLCAETIKARERAYCPYSHFRVGATLLTTSGSFISGANVENAAYPSGTCAERCALGTAVGGMGLRRGDFRAIGVVTDLGRKTGGPASPCGMCRQALREFLDLSTPIFMFYGEGDGGCVVKTMGELLPMSFGPDTLPPPDAMDQIQARS